MNFETVLFEKKGRVALLTINRPQAMNAINSQVWWEMGNALEEFANDPELWVAVITGAGNRSFCAGADLKEVAAGRSLVPEGGEKWGFAGITQHFVNKPIIAAVNGFALGGGTEIALSCDLVVASELATFGLPEVKRGILAAAGGLLRLPRQIPLKIAVEAIVTGESMTAADALRWGLINRVVPHDQVVPAAIELALKICENAPLAVRTSKEIIYQGLDVSLDHPPRAWEINEKLSSEVLSWEDAKEGTRAFAEKRKPNWIGR